MLRRSPRAPRLAGLLLAALVIGSCIPAVLNQVPRPAPNGTLRIGYPDEPVSLNPIRAISPAERDLLRPILPSFHLVSPALEYLPYLLADEPSVEVEGDRMIVGFQIRDQAVWSDGEPITVRDVRFTWRVMMDPDLPVADRHGFEFIRAVEGISDREGRLVISPPYAGWRDLFSAGRFVLPAHAADATPVRSWDEGPPVTAGPFRLERWRRGLTIRLEHDPRFFGLHPLVERIKVLFVPDASTAVDLLQEGKLDAVAPMLGVGWSHRLEELPEVGANSADGPWLVTLAFNADAGLDPGLRRGLADGIDRRRFAEVVLRGDGRVSDSLLTVDQAGYRPAWRRYRPGKGTILSTPPITLVYPHSELAILAARFLQTQLGLSGVPVELVGLDHDEFWGRWLPGGRFDAALWETRSGPSPWLERWFGADGATAVTRFLDPTVVDRLQDAARHASYDEADLASVQRMLASLVPALPLFQVTATVAARDGVTGLAANASVDGTFWNAWNWAID